MYLVISVALKSGLLASFGLDEPMRPIRAFSTNSYSRCYVSNQLQDDKYQVANLPKARISILPLEQKCNITCLGAHLPEDFNIIKVKGKNYSNSSSRRVSSETIMQNYKDFGLTVS